MKFKTLTAALLATAGLAVAGSASAFSLGYAGPVKFVFSNVDAGTVGYDTSVNPSCTDVLSCDAAAAAPAPGAIGSEDTWAIFEITAIKRLDNDVTLWTAGDNGEYLTGMLYGLTDYTVNHATLFGSTYFEAFAAGGEIKVFLESDNDYTTAGGPGSRCGLDCYPNVTDGNLFLHMQFDAGADASDPNAEYYTMYNNTGINGTGAGFLSVIGGAFADSFDTDGFTNYAGTQSDMVLSTSFTGQNVSNGWTVTSSGHTEANVPEPGTLALLGLGLAGLGYTARRRRG